MPEVRETFRCLSDHWQTVVTFSHFYWLERRRSSVRAKSRADFICKYAIALKEARETIYWLRLIQETLSDGDIKVAELIGEAEEISKIVGAIIVNTKRQDPPKAKG